ncbi:hypothetical protein HYFRA_00011763 [Hymenoscyphus fraxineus]|uniref:2EXR domain-containing protein n=1 Tax=Hymenoscyphus fraxineus TaxID=746836 RepID=A0A9N9L8A4_9HELO|nr:hypothetical protein HYFRA_00011763 [Hymenoscyphus fraxineus]
MATDLLIFRITCTVHLHPLICDAQRSLAAVAGVAPCHVPVTSVPGPPIYFSASTATAQWPMHDAISESPPRVSWAPGLLLLCAPLSYGDWWIVGLCHLIYSTIRIRPFRLYLRFIFEFIFECIFEARELVRYLNKAVGSILENVVVASKSTSHHLHLASPDFEIWRETKVYLQSSALKRKSTTRQLFAVRPPLILVSYQKKISMSTQPSERNNMDLKQQFKLFPNLPIELRRMIWNFTLEPRTVCVAFDSPFHDLGDQHHRAKGFFTKTLLPTALHVCRDSREAVIKSYPLAFGSVLTSPKTRFNFNIDTLFLDDDMDRHFVLFFNAMKYEELTRIKRLALDDIEDELWDQNPYGYSSSGGYIIDKSNILRILVPQMTSLEEIYGVHTIWDDDDEEPIPCSNGPKQLFEKLPKGLKVDYDYDWGKSLSNDSMPKEIAGVKVTPVWGWSPTNEWLESIMDMERMSD